ncbi:glutamyl-tRNA reductase [Arthrobacter tumbae]|uniref:glutamyl-tRNA reductase n=1 Tax=Arthrobacter tumbae TaxID=163874 RepID=UPI0019562E90|nr:glutamyl-tRNA reductase [Arthrobacter tumbae]MBM7780516.1 glutamyl-tRNA reductase [Arthrobacter tumbae]
MAAVLRSICSQAEPGGKNPVLVALVVNYRDLDVDAAARLHTVSAPLLWQLLTDGPAVSGVVVLSTCSRFEIYCQVSSDVCIVSTRSTVLSALSRCSGLSLSRLFSIFRQIQGQLMVRHLFTVASGLDSVIAGEHQIGGQVRRALSEAQAAGTATGALIRLFQASSRTAKTVATRTTVNASGRSIAALSLDIALSVTKLKTLADASVVIFGTGAYAAHIMEVLKGQKCAAVFVYSWTGRAEDFVAVRGGTALSLPELPAAIAAADIILGCSGNGARLDASALGAWRQHAPRPLVAIDLSPTNDFDPAIADLPGLELLTLKSIRRAAPEADIEALRQAHGLVEDAVHRFEEQESIRQMDSAIVALRQHVESVLATELEKVHEQGGGTAVPEAGAALRRMAQQLLHTPMVRAREMATAGEHHAYIAALDALFGISVALPDPDGSPGAPEPGVIPRPHRGQPCHPQPRGESRAPGYWPEACPSREAAAI